MSEDTINQSIQLSKTGRSQDARKLLRPLLEAEPGNEKAWLWYANTFDTVEDKIKALKNCLAYCPNSKMANDGIRLLMTKLPAPEHTTIEDASDIQKDSVQFTDLESKGREEDGEENKYDLSASTSSFEDHETIPNLDDRMQIIEYGGLPVDAGIPGQEGIAAVNKVVDFPVPESKPKDNREKPIVKAFRTPETGHPTGREYRTPFIIFSILGVILFITLALIITILLFTS